MRHRLATVLVASTVALPGVAAAQFGLDFAQAEDWNVAASIARVRPEVEGDLLLGEELGATDIDVDDVLGLDADDVHGGRFELKFGGHRLRFEYLPVGYEGDELLSEPVEVFGVPFAAGDFVDSELGARRYRVDYRYDIRFGDHVALAPIFGLDVLDAWVEVADRDISGASFEEDVLALVPLGGLRLEVRPLPRLELFVEARGMAAGGLGPLDDLRVLGGEGGVALSLTRNVVVRGSFAVSDYRVVFGDVDVDLRQAGPSLELELRF